MNTTAIQDQIRSKKAAQQSADLQHAQQKAQTNRELDTLRQKRDYCKEQEKAQREYKKKERERAESQWEQEGKRLAQEEAGRLKEESLLERLIRLTSDYSENGGGYED